ncbi:hypothetical protein SMICM304S_08196 [Streptomyces microflavus]
MTTEIASAVESVPEGDLSLVRPSAVTPSRSSRKTVTTRRISESPCGAAGRSSERPIWSTRRETMSTSASGVAGSGRTTVLNRRRSALESSLTPRSRSLAVAMTLKPRTAWTSCPSSGMGKVFSDRIVMSESCTSAGMRVSSSTRAVIPSDMARISGLGTSASRLGPWARSLA